MVSSTDDQPHDPEIGPPAFYLVDLRNESTWVLAPLEDWILERRRIEQKLGPRKSRDQRRRRVTRLLLEVDKEFRRAERQRRRRITEVYSPGQERRLGRRQRQALDKHGLLDSLLTPWESEFHSRSAWLERIGANPDWPHEANKLCNQLVRRSLRAERGVSQRNAAEYARRLELVGASAEKRNPRNRHPLMPRPLELLQVYRLTLLLMRCLARGFETYKEMNLCADEYGAAFPCPKCKRKHLHSANAVFCCDSRSWEGTPDYSNVIVLGGSAHRQALIEYLRALRLQQYWVALELHELLAWDHWQTLSSRRLAGTAKAFLASLFGAELDTVERCLAKSSLDREYDRHGFAEADRIYLPEAREHHFAILPRQGWYEHAPPEERLSMFEGRSYTDLWPGVGGA